MLHRSALGTHQLMVRRGDFEHSSDVDHEIFVRKDKEVVYCKKSSSREENLYCIVIFEDRASP
jgi:hypothetical protein